MLEMDNLLAELDEIVRVCAEASAPVAKEPLKTTVDRLQKAITEVSAASSGSWLGYHAHVYYSGFRRPRPGDHFDSEWGLMGTYSRHVSENWLEVGYDDVHAAIIQRAGDPDTTELEALAKTAAQIFKDQKPLVLTTLSVLIDRTRAVYLEEVREEVMKLKLFTPSDVEGGLAPSGGFMSRDSTAVMQGLQVPHHVRVLAWLTSLQLSFSSVEQLGKAAGKSIDYIRKSGAAQPAERVAAVAASATAKIFIGHGHSALWKELKDFIQDRLRLSWEEFNRESTAGKSTKERLEEMLATSTFAFLVMTAEDEHADATLHARENVIHEVGLFQGKLGFNRAIVILESGCQEFTNIVGLGQIRFPRGSISGAFEEIRKVLEREGIIKVG
jgi:predicted nucleotide-binding protein